MKKNTAKIAAFLTALTCTVGVSSCGRDVPTVEDSQGEFSVAGGVDESSEGEESVEESAVTTQTKPVTTASTALSSETTSAETTYNVSIVTRSKEELSKLTTASKATATKPATTKAPAAAGGNSTTTANGTGGGSTTQPATTGGSGVSGITLSYYSADITVGQTLQYPLVSENITEVWTSSDTSIATVDSIGNITGVGEGSCVIKVVSADNSSLGAEVKVTVKAKSTNDRVQVIDGITYIDNILIANKSYSLPQSYDPGGLTNATYNAFTEMAADAANQGLNMQICSGYRSYSYQETLYNNYCWEYGQEVADTFSARPGNSEHQSGMAIDVNSASDIFMGTPEAIWLAEHCTEYGFIIRYPEGKQRITGYKYEPWHIRYVGKEFAKTFKDYAASVGDPNLTLEEYFGIDSVYPQ